MEQDQSAGDGDHLIVPSRSQSEHCTATSSAQEVEDCEDLEVAGIDSETNIVGVAWTRNSKEQELVNDDGTVNQVEELKEIAGQNRRHGNLGDDENDDDDYDDGKPQDRPSLCQSQSGTEVLRWNRDRFDSSDKDDDDDGDASKPRGTTDKPPVVAFRQSSTETGEPREIRSQYQRSKNHIATVAADDDFDDSEEDGDEHTGVAVKPTFCPFTALSAAAGGDHSSADNEAKNIAEGKEDTSQDENPATATIATAVSKEPVHQQQSFYGTSSEDDDDDDAVNGVDRDDKVDDVCEKKSMAVPSTAPADSFDDVFAQNFDTQSRAVDQNRTAVEIASSDDDVQRPEHDEVEELEDKVTKGLNSGDDQRSRISRWTSSVTRALGPSHDDDDDDFDEDVDIVGGKAGTGDNNDLNAITSMVETKSAFTEAHGKEAEHEVRIRLFCVV